MCTHTWKTSFCISNHFHSRVCPFFPFFFLLDEIKQSDTISLVYFEIFVSLKTGSWKLIIECQKGWTTDFLLWAYITTTVFVVTKTHNQSKHLTCNIKACGVCTKYETFPFGADCKHNCPSVATGLYINTIAFDSFPSYRTYVFFEF